MFLLRKVCAITRQFEAYRFSWSLVRTFSTQKSYSENESNDAPIKYTTSDAFHWKAAESRTGGAKERLPYEPYVVIVSVAVFLIYFGFLREENDIDVELGRSLYSRLEGLEEHQLKLSLEYNKNNNLDTESIVKRLEEIQREKAAQRVQ